MAQLLKGIGAAFEEMGAAYGGYAKEQREDALLAAERERAENLARFKAKADMAGRQYTATENRKIAELRETGATQRAEKSSEEATSRTMATIESNEKVKLAQLEAQKEARLAAAESKAEMAAIRNDFERQKLELKQQELDKKGTGSNTGKIDAEELTAKILKDNKIDLSSGKQIPASVLNQINAARKTAGIEPITGKEIKESGFLGMERSKWEYGTGQTEETKPSAKENVIDYSKFDKSIKPDVAVNQTVPKPQPVAQPPSIVKDEFVGPPVPTTKDRLEAQGPYTAPAPSAAKPVSSGSDPSTVAKGGFDAMMDEIKRNEIQSAISELKKYEDKYKSSGGKPTETELKVIEYYTKILRKHKVIK